MGECSLHDSTKDLLSDINSTTSTDVDLLLQIDIMSKNCSHYPCACSNNLRPCQSLANGSGLSPLIFCFICKCIILFHGDAIPQEEIVCRPIRNPGMNLRPLSYSVMWDGRKKKKKRTSITQLRYKFSVQNYR